MDKHKTEQAGKITALLQNIMSSRFKKKKKRESEELMEHNLLRGCILSCKEISAQSHYRKSKGTHLSSITPCFTDRKRRQRNSS